MERFYETEGYESGSNVLRMVGYFALVGLLRVHTLVGDYGGALAALAPIHPFQRAHLFTPKIAGARRPSIPSSGRTCSRPRLLARRALHPRATVRTYSCTSSQARGSLSPRASARACSRPRSQARRALRPRHNAHL